MKKIILLILLCLPVLKGLTQEKTAKQLEVESAVMSYFNGVSNRDINAIRATSTPDFILLENGLVWNLDSMQQKLEIRVGHNFQRANSFAFINTEVTKNMAWANFRTTAVITIDDKTVRMQWLCTAILEKSGGAWKMKEEHGTLVSSTPK